MQRQHHHQPEEHRESIKDIEIDLMVCNGSMPALAKLDEPKDVADEQQSHRDVQASIDRSQGGNLDAVDRGSRHIDEGGQEEQDDTHESCQANDQEDAANCLAAAIGRRTTIP